LTALRSSTVEHRREEHVVPSEPTRRRRLGVAIVVFQPRLQLGRSTGPVDGAK